MSLADAAGVLFKSYIEHPVQLVLGSPVLVDGLACSRKGATRWITYQRYNSSFDPILIADNNAINLAGTPYDESQPSLAVQLLANNGLLTLTTYYDGGSGPAGYPEKTQLQQGTAGAPIMFNRFEYTSNTDSFGNTIYPVSQQTIYQSSAGGGGDPATTSYTYQFYPGTNQMLEQDMTLPAIPTGQNGSSLSPVQREQYDQYGNMIWEQGPRGFIDYFAYDIVTGAITQMIEDVDPSLVTLPTGWTRPSGLPAPLHLITDYTHDSLGRITQQLGPVHLVDGIDVRTAAWTVYLDTLFQTWAGQGYASAVQ